MFCELGGELVDTNHADLIALAGELGVEIQELKAGDKGVDLYFFGGNIRRRAALIPPFHLFAQKLTADSQAALTIPNRISRRKRPGSTA